MTNDWLSEVLQDLATSISENQHELEHEGINFTDARLADDEAIAEAKQAIIEYVDKQVKNAMLRQRAYDQRLIEARIEAYKQALYDVGYGFSPIKELPSVEERLNTLQAQTHKEKN